MHSVIVKLSLAIRCLKNEEGQDLVEYALLIALIAFASTAGMGVLAGDINSAFASIGAALTIA